MHSSTYGAGWAAIVAACFLITACGGGGGGGDQGPPPVVLQSIAIASSASTQPLSGQTRQLTATGTYSDGHTSDITAAATWASATSAVVTVSPAGLATAIAPGSSVVTATLNGISGQTTIVVPALESMRIAPSPSTLILKVGEKTQLSIQGTYSDGQVATITNATWEVYPAIASISSSGQVTATGGGRAIIIAKEVGGMTAPLNLDVTQANGWLIGIASPAPGRPVNARTAVEVTVSGFPVTVSASIGNSSTGLQRCSRIGATACWEGELDLSAVPRGRQTLVITVTDAAGNQITDSRAVEHDDLPVVRITKPEWGSVSRSTLQLAATCMDDDPAGCGLLIAYWCDTDPCVKFAQEGTASLEAEFNDLSAFDGRMKYIVFYGRDSAGQFASATVPAYVDVSPRLQPLAQVPGLLLDADADRLLYASQDLGTLSIRNRATGADTMIYSAAPGSLEGATAFLTATGAAFNAVDKKLRSWESGTLIDLGDLTDTTLKSFDAAGSWLLWNNGAVLTRRNLSTQANVIVTNDSANAGNGVAPTGAVAFSTSLQDSINLYRPDGTIDQLALDATSYNRFPLTDGTAVLYVKQARSSGLAPKRLTFIENGTEQELASTQSDIRPGPGYQIASGWAAYLKPDAGGANQVWRRNPLNQLAQLTALPVHTMIDRLGADGTITLTTQATSTTNSRRYLVRGTDSTPSELNSALGKTIFIGNEPHLLMGNALFAIQ